MKASFTELINGDLPVLVDFYAEWCGPCLQMMPTVKAVAAALSGKAKVIKVDIDKNLPVAEKYKIMGVPTFILFHQGEIKWRQAGVLSKEQILSSVETFLPMNDGGNEQ